MNGSRTKLAAAISMIGVLTALTAVQTASGGAGDQTLGVSTTAKRIVPDGSPGFKYLTTGPGEPYTVRDGSEEGGIAIGSARPNREKRRTSISYFGQLTDFQLADEESPLRVEFLDPQGGAFTSSWRAVEALNPHEEDAMIRQFNAFADNPPNRERGGAKPKMDFVVNTGDISDNNQYNEALWNLQLVEGGVVRPGSGVDPAPYIGRHPLCPPGMNVRDAANPEAYTGVQDRDDWPGPTMGYFWDPDQPDPGPVPVNPFSDWPSYPGLMDRAQQPFRAAGLKVPAYQVFGNHDSLVQGNAWSSRTFNQIATGCLKPINDDEANSGRSTAPLLNFVVNPNFTTQDLLDMRADEPNYFMEVPPDPDRRLISKKEHMNLYRSTGKSNGHGFGFVEGSERTASDGFASYYSFRPRPGVRYIAMDTTSEGGVVLTSDKGNLDNPQFEWVERQLRRATHNNEIVVLFSHHAASSMTANVPDENAPSCQNVNPVEVPGCDGDPRDSTPIHLGDDVNELLLKYPVAIAWVAGHSHVNDVTPVTRADGSNGFWSIRTSALADWPKQNRLLEIFDNRDGNLSIFGTVIDHAGRATAPPAGTPAANLNTSQLASLARAIGHNDNQTGADACGVIRCGEGEPRDRNVELLIKDPRRPQAIVNRVTIRPKHRRIRPGRAFRAVIRVNNFRTATSDARRVRVRIRSSNPRVRVRRQAVIQRIRPGRFATLRIPVRVRRNARGRARITVNVGGRRASAIVRVIPNRQLLRRARR